MWFMKIVSLRTRLFISFDWDAVVYFDERQDFLKKVYPDAHYIPFPCFPLRQGDRIKARKTGTPFR